jgi:hypothetical protein
MLLNMAFAIAISLQLHTISSPAKAIIKRKPNRVLEIVKENLNPTTKVGQNLILQLMTPY